LAHGAAADIILLRKLKLGRQARASPQAAIEDALAEVRKELRVERLGIRLFVKRAHRIAAPYVVLGIE
jgi:hypothetical protein